SAEQGHWWGAWEDDRLVSIASFNAYYHPVAQVGGVYTAPPWRRRGFSRAVMQTLMRDASEVHALERLILFTGEQARAARALYDALGFESIGAYGLYFGEAREADGVGE
ncbi:MAG: GNAT family N-acetyltransferase, partial [Vicinamibacteria bacterium]